MKAPKTPEEIAEHNERVRKDAENRLRAGGRAITSEEKRAVVERLLKVWEKNPELRFGQMLMNLDYDKADLFYMEDRSLCVIAEKFSSSENKKT